MIKSGFWEKLKKHGVAGLPRAAMHKYIENREIREKEAEYKEKKYFCLRGIEQEININIQEMGRGFSDWVKRAPCFDIYFNRCIQFYKKKPEDCAKLFEKADEIVQGQITVYGTTFNFQRQVDWNLDHETASRWPKLFYKRYRLPDRSGKFGDYRLNWELNRQQYFFLLGLAFELSRDEKYAQCILDHISSWIEQNPLYYTLNWMSSMEVALRSIAWCFGIFFITDSKSISSCDYNKILASLYQQTHFLIDNLSIDLHKEKGASVSLKNNHTIVELAGVLVIFSALDWLKIFHMKNRENDWVNSLLCELQRQTFSDGMHVEQSTSYLRFVLEAVALAAFSVSDQKHRDQFIGFLRKYEKTLSMFLYSDRKFHLCGDEDNGHVVTYYHKSEPDSIVEARMLLECLSESQNDKTEPFQSGSQIKLAVNLSADNFMLPESGHWIYRGNWLGKPVMIHFRCGPMDFPDLRGYAPHSHCDLLAISMYFDGFPVLIDCGTFSYHNQALRNAFRSSMSHNTILFDDVEQMDFMGPFNSKMLAQGQMLSGDQYHAEGTIVVEQSGCRVEITRKLAVKPDMAELHVHETLEASKSGRIFHFFNLHPLIEIGNPAEWTLPDRNYNMSLNGFSGLKIVDSWCSFEYCVKEKTNRVFAEDNYDLQKTWTHDWSIKMTASQNTSF